MLYLLFLFQKKSLQTYNYKLLLTKSILAYFFNQNEIDWHSISLEAFCR